MGCSQATSAVISRDFAAWRGCKPDAIKAEFTYKGWQDDLRHAKKTAASDPTLFLDEMQQMERKQKLHIGDLSCTELRAIDVVRNKFTYKGWQHDLKEVEHDFIKYPDLIACQLQRMERKQMVHIGDRSSSELQAIDAVKNKFTYKGWQKDLKEVEHDFVKYPDLIASELQRMERKQKLHIGDRSSAELRAIDAVKDKFTYNGWQNDLIEIQDDVVKYGDLIEEQLQQMERKQKAHVGDRSSTEPKAIDAVEDKFTYKGRQKDLKDVEDLFVKHPTLIQTRLEETKLKQKVRIGEAISNEIDTLKALKSRQHHGGIQDD